MRMAYDMSTGQSTQPSVSITLQYESICAHTGIDIAPTEPG